MSLVLLSSHLIAVWNSSATLFLMWWVCTQAACLCLLVSCNFSHSYKSVTATDDDNCCHGARADEAKKRPDLTDCYVDVVSLMRVY